VFKPFNSSKSAKERIPYFLLEIFLISFSVFLAFSVSQCQESNKTKKRGQIALENIRLEIESNRDEVGGVIDHHKELIDRMKSVPDSISDGKTAFQVFLYCLENNDPHIPLIESSAWKTALADGSIQTIDYFKLSRISKLYGGQEVGFSTMVKNFVERIHDPEMHSPEEYEKQFTSLMMIMQNIFGNEIYFVNECDSVLAEL